MIIRQSHPGALVQQSTPSDHAMNFLNSDFSESGESSKSIDEFREFYLSQSNKLQEEKSRPNMGSVDDDSLLYGKAGPLGTLFWNTVVLCERTAVNYERNLLAYGVRVGMYGGMFLGFLEWLSFVADEKFLSPGMGLMLA
jgi:hypothetical protein